MTDRQLYRLCKKYGARALTWRRKFAGLLPEVNRRRLYEKKGFSSIFEFAAKLAGMTQEQVRLVLNLEERFTDKPLLKQLLTTGEVSVNKLGRIASVATPDNEGFWAHQSKILSNRALETFIRDSRIEDKDGLNKAENERSGLHVQTKTLTQRPAEQSSFQLSREVEVQLLALQNKGIDVNALLLELLKIRELEIAREKEQLASQPTVTNPKSRYIQAPVKKLLAKEHGTKCSAPHCLRNSEAIHHTQRFGLNRSHDPHFLAPLCKEHHLIAHAMDRKFQSMRGSAIRARP